MFAYGVGEGWMWLCRGCLTYIIENLIECFRFLRALPTARILFDFYERFSAIYGAHRFANKVTDGLTDVQRSCFVFVTSFVGLFKKMCWRCCQTSKLKISKTRRLQNLILVALLGEKKNGITYLEIFVIGEDLDHYLYSSEAKIYH